MTAHKVVTYPFGAIEFYDHYVIGRIKPDFTVDTEVARTIIKDITDHYGRKKMVYLSNRVFSHKVDLSVYKLVNPKLMVGIGIIAPNKKEISMAAGQEQALYEGSFGIFDNEDSAVSWATSFIQELETSQ